MLVQLFCDNLNSWIIPHVERLNAELNDLGYPTIFISDPEQIQQGDVLILLSCEKIFRNLYLNKYNLVVHESDLPKGKGWSPLTWQVLEGETEITISLFEAEFKVDSGKIYEQYTISLDGTELIDELRNKQFEATRFLIKNFLKKYPNVTGRVQTGEESYYHKRTPSDSRLNIEKSIKDQFNLLRICDNERYPAYFEMKETRYIVKIYKA